VKLGKTKKTKMKIGIIGPSQSGKSTVFKILLEAHTSGTIGVFKDLDKRVGKVSEAFSSKKTTYPELIFVDLGSTSNISKKDLSCFQDIDLFVCVIGAFFSEQPKRDFENCLTDIIVSDLDLIQNRITRLEKEGKRQETEQELRLLEKCQAFISEGRPLLQLGLSQDEIKLFSGLFLLSLKPLILAINTSDEKREVLETKVKELEGFCASKGLSSIRFFGKTELELLELASGERENFLKEIGPGYNFREEFLRLITKELNLITFFTSGDKETKGWYLKSGLSVIEAAGKIHSDMKRGFIRAEVVNYEDFIKCGSIHKASEAGVLKVEGKDYIVKDGDIINIRFNV